MKEIAKKAHMRIDDGRDENLRGSTNWIRERLLYPSYATYIRTCIYGDAITEESRAFQRTYRRLRNCAPAMWNFHLLK